MKRQVSALIMRRVLKGDAIILNLYSYGKSVLFNCELTVEQARALLSQLDEAVALMTAKPVEDAR